MTVASVLLLKPEAAVSEKIRLVLNDDPNTRDKDLETLKTWLKQQPHLPDEMEDCCMLSFMRASNFYLEKAKRKIDMYFTMRTAWPELFTNRDITSPELVKLSQKARGAPTPGLTPDGYRVTICKALTKELNPDYLNDGFKLAMMIGDVRIREEGRWGGVAGDIFVLDASIASASHLAKLSLPELKKFSICIQEAYPVKVKQVHIINVSPLIDTFYNLVKHLLKEKIRKRIYFHKDYTTLHKYIPDELLPGEYGGTGYSLEEINNAWIEKLKEYRDYFKEQESLKANEALRPGKPTNYGELFGIDGCFRQLSID